MNKFRHIIVLTFLLANVLYSVKSNAQNNRVAAEKCEEIFSHWYKGLETARRQVSADNEEYLVFQRFYESRITGLRAEFLKSIAIKNADSTLVSNSTATEVSGLVELYNQFKKTEQEFPASVDEYRHVMPKKLLSVCDTAGCSNIGFEQGTLNGWNAYYAYNDNFGADNFFNITNITGGPVGAVTEAANDTLTSNAAFYNPSVGPDSTPDYQISITSGTRGDAIAPNVPVVSPFGGKYSAMIGDSTGVNFGVAILSKTFFVTLANADFTYEYSVFLENPGSHTYYEQPFFLVALLDQNGDTIPFCGQYQVVSSNSNAEGFSAVYIPPYGLDDGLGGDSAYYKDWTIVSVALRKYIGQCVTIVFESGDCSRGGHFGYAYVDASCSPLQIITSSPTICGQNYITLTGPPGFIQYKWSSNTGQVIANNTSQVIKADSAGTYQLIVTPVTGLTCADTLSITINKSSGVVPVPDFKADTTCTGQITSFINTSNPINSNAKFYWDFYNLGVFQDSSVNPQWSFNAPGTYTVKLYEIINGCGADTALNVVVTPPPVPLIVAPPNTCSSDPFTLSASGGTSYLWNNGETGSSITVSPSVADSVFYVKVTEGCSDTAYAKVHIIPIQQVEACCDTIINYGSSATVKAIGCLSYIWSPASTLNCDTCVVAISTPSVTTTYTVSAIDSNGCRSTDTVTVEIERCANAWIPNAFTPNGDGRDDVFEPKGTCIYYYTMYIFDRWGSIIYKTTNSKPWDGTVNGRMVQEDTYVYELIVTTTDFKQRTYIGNVTVIR